MTIRELISSMWRNYPDVGSTMCDCTCGRSSKRSSESCCAICLRVKLMSTGKVDAEQARKWTRLIGELRELQETFVIQIGEDTEL